MIDSEGYIKLIDFGVSKINHDPNEEETDFVGSNGYYAPEILKKTNKRKHSFPVDWWAVGIVTFELIMGVGEVPFGADYKAILKNDIANELPNKKENHRIRMSDDCRQFIKDMCEKEPKNRLGGKDNIK